LLPVLLVLFIIKTFDIIIWTWFPIITKIVFWWTQPNCSNYEN